MSDSITDSLEKAAPHWMWAFSGSLFLLSVTLNQIGFGNVVDAYADKLVADTKRQEVVLNCYQCSNSELSERLKKVEALAHKGGVTHK